jgi:hypothetical protein
MGRGKLGHTQTATSTFATPSVRSLLGKDMSAAGDKAGNVD